MKSLLKNKLVFLFTISVACAVVTVILMYHTRSDNGFIQFRQGDVSRSVTWPRSDLPINLYVNPNALSWLPFIMIAAKGWNDVVGVNVFVVTTQDCVCRINCFGLGVPKDPIVFISESAVKVGNEGGHAILHHDSNANIRCADLVFMNDVEDNLRSKVVAHELGHTLGLDHDEIEESVMYFGGQALQWGMDAVTQKDSELLRETYGDVY